MSNLLTSDSRVCEAIIKNSITFELYHCNNLYCEILNEKKLCCIHANSIKRYNDERCEGLIQYYLGEEPVQCDKVFNEIVQGKKYCIDHIEAVNYLPLQSIRGIVLKTKSKTKTQKLSPIKNRNIQIKPKQVK
jgi:hypothetical protein